MAVIYNRTIEDVRDGADRVHLSAAQLNITKFALQSYLRNHGADTVADGMLRQLEMSRRAYAALAM